jgi:hypothetical protein
VLVSTISAKTVVLVSVISASVVHWCQIVASWLYFYAQKDAPQPPENFVRATKSIDAHQPIRWSAQVPAPSGEAGA